MIVVDASVWVARFVRDDVHHVQSSDWLLTYLAAGHLVVAPILLLAEVGGAVSRRTGRVPQGQRAVQTLLDLPGVELHAVDHALGRQAADVSSTYRLGGADAVYVALAHHLDVPLVTWDAEQLARGGRLAVVQPPSSFPL